MSPPTDCQAPKPPSSIVVDTIKAGAVGWINSADIKATALMTINGTLFAITGTGFIISDKERVGRLAGVLVLALGVSLLVSTFFAARTILPRTDRAEILKDPKAKGPLRCWRAWRASRGAEILKDPKAKGPLPSSLTYFGDIKENFDGFIATVEATTPELIERDNREQAYVVAYIAKEKMKAVRRAVLAHQVALALLLSALATTTVQYLCNADKKQSADPPKNCSCAEVKNAAP